MIEWLEPDEKPEVFWKSSISQKKSTLSVLVRGEWVPIAFDSLDYITCDSDGFSDCNKYRPVSHCAIVTDGDDIGYDFNVGQCNFLSEKYVSHDHKEVVKKQLPIWFGSGEYEEHVDTRALINGDFDALGSVSYGKLRIGLAYALAKHTLPSDDD